MSEGLAKIKAQGSKDYVPVVRKAWCGLGRQCTEDMVKSFSSMVTPGGMIETLLKSQIGQDVDLRMFGPVVLQYYDSYCAKHGGAGAAKARAAPAAEDLDNREDL